MAAKTPRATKIRIELGASASPERVAVAAMMIDAAIKAIDPEAEEGITMIVRNKDLVAEVRGRSTVGVRVVRQIGDVLEHPDRALAKSRGSKITDAADALAKGLDGLGDITAGFFWGESRTPFKKDSGKALAGTVRDAIKTAKKRAAVKQAPTDWPANWSTEQYAQTSDYTPVLRFGRTAEGGKATALIVVYGRTVSVDVPSSLEANCALMTASRARCRVSVQYRCAGPGDYDRYEMLDIDPSDREKTTQEFVDYVQAHADVVALGFNDLLKNLAIIRDDRH